MIVLPSGFTLSAGLGGVSLKNARIGYQAWTIGAAASQVTVSSESLANPKDAPLRPNTWEYWQPTSLPATWEIIFNDFLDVDYIGILGTLGSSRVACYAETTDGTSSGSPSEFTWDLFAQEVLPSNDMPIMLLDDLRSARGVRLTFSASGFTTKLPKIMVVYPGPVLAMPEPIRGGGHAPLNLKRQTVLRQPLSRGGQFLDQSYRRLGEMSTATFEHLLPDWYRENFDPLVEAARTRPFFFAWRPEEYPEEVGFAWNEGDIHPQYEGVFDWMSVTLNMRGLGHE